MATHQRPERRFTVTEDGKSQSIKVFDTRNWKMRRSRAGPRGRAKAEPKKETPKPEPLRGSGQGARSQLVKPVVATKSRPPSRRDQVQGRRLL